MNLLGDAETTSPTTIMPAPNLRGCCPREPAEPSMPDFFTARTAPPARNAAGKLIKGVPRERAAEEETHARCQPR